MKLSCLVKIREPCFEAFHAGTIYRLHSATKWRLQLVCTAAKPRCAPSTSWHSVGSASLDSMLNARPLLHSNMAGGCSWVERKWFLRETAPNRVCRFWKKVTLLRFSKDFFFFEHHTVRTIQLYRPEEKKYFPVNFSIMLSKKVKVSKYYQPNVFVK